MNLLILYKLEFACGLVILLYNNTSSRTCLTALPARLSTNLGSSRSAKHGITRAIMAFRTCNAHLTLICLSFGLPNRIFPNLVTLLYVQSGTPCPRARVTMDTSHYTGIGRRLSTLSFQKVRNFYSKKRIVLQIVCALLHFGHCEDHGKRCTFIFYQYT